MALNKRQKYLVLIAFTAVAVLIAAWQLIVIVIQIQTPPAISVARDADEMVAGYNEVKPNATQNDVIGIMGSQFAVEKCPQDADPNCAHIWHYEAGDQAWDFTFDMDGNLMAKQIVAAGQ